jgi:dienelactone hydrolase
MHYFRLGVWTLVVGAVLIGMTLVRAGEQAGENPVDTSTGDRLVAEYFRLETERLAAKTLADVQTLTDWEAKRPELQRQLFEMLGLDPLPPKTDLQPVITGKTEHEEFTVEKLHFQSSPGLYVTGNLYLPKNATGPLPTVLYVCGHAVVKKDGVSFGNKVGYQHHGGWYARNGYACLSIDTLQLGEIEGIHHGTHREGMWWWHARGYTPAGVEAWNCIRALDYLETRPEIDKNRIGVCGRSGGGAYSWWIAALDERIKVAVPVAGITTLKNHVVDGCIEGHCDCMFQTNTYGWDYATVAALVAPRPLLIANTDKDGIFPLDGVVQVHSQVRRIYELYGKPAHLGLNITEGPHKDTQELQVHEFVWFNRFLKQAESPIDKVAVKFFEPEQLKVFATLPTDQRNTTIHEVFVPAAQITTPTSSAEWDTMKSNWLKQLMTLSFRAWPEGQSPVELRTIRSDVQSGIRWTEHEYLSQEPYRLSLWGAQPASLDPQQAKRVELHVLDQVEWEQISLWMERARQGEEAASATEKAKTPEESEFHAFLQMCRQPDAYHVFFAPRGIGPTEWTRNERERAHIRRRFALLGQTDDSARVWDTRRAIQAVRSIPSLSEIPLTISSKGRAAGWCLYASLFEPPVADLQLTDLPVDHASGPIFLNVSRILEFPQAVAMAADRSRVALRFSGTESRTGWEFARTVGTLIGQRPDVGLTIE